MNKLNSLKHLVSKHQNCFHRKLSFAVIEQVFERRPEQINDHDVVVTLYAKPVHVWHSDSALQDPVKFCFVEKLRVLGPDWLQLNGNFLIRPNVCTVVYIPKSSAAKFARKPIFATYS